MFRRHRKVYLEVNDEELALIRFSLLKLRDKLLARNLDTDTVDNVLKKVFA